MEESMTILHAVSTHQFVHVLSEEALPSNTDRLRALQRPRHIRPLLPIEMEKTRQTPVICMLGIPESIRHAAKQVAATPVQLQSSRSVVTEPLQDAHPPVPMKHAEKGSHEPGGYGPPPV